MKKFVVEYYLTNEESLKWRINHEKIVAKWNEYLGILFMRFPYEKRKAND